MAEYRYLRVNVLNGVAVVHFVDAWATTDLAKGLLGKELFAVAGQEGCSKVLLNCAELTYACSAMIGKLLSLNKELDAKGAKLTLCALTPSVKEIFNTMKLAEILDIRETESEGVASFE